MVHFQFYILYSAFSLASSAVLDGYFYSGIAFSAKETCNAAFSTSWFVGGSERKAAYLLEQPYHREDTCDDLQCCLGRQVPRLWNSAIQLPQLTRIISPSLALISGQTKANV